MRPCSAHPWPEPTAPGLPDGQRLHLADGRSVLLSPLQGRDAEAEQAFVSALSATSRYRRFHLGIRSLSPDQLQALTQIDQHSHVALVARPAEGPEQARIVADARYVRCADSGEAEFAIAVADAWQGIGLGSALLERLGRHARAHGVQLLYGDVLWGNDPMIGLVRQLGGRLSRHPGDATLVRARFEVGAEG